MNSGTVNLPYFRRYGRQQHGQQHVAAGPAHQVDRGVIALEGDQAGHGDERGGAHPVGAGGHAVEHRVHALAGHVELRGAEPARARMAMKM